MITPYATASEPQRVYPHSRNSPHWWSVERAELRVLPSYPDRIREVRVGLPRNYGYDRAFVGLDARSVTVEMQDALHRLRQSTVKTDRGVYPGAGLFPNFAFESLRAQRSLTRGNTRWLLALVTGQQLYVLRSELEGVELLELSPASFPDNLSQMPTPVAIIADNAAFGELSSRQKDILTFYARLGRVHLVGRAARPITGHEHLIGIDNVPESSQLLTADMKPAGVTPLPTAVHQVGSMEQSGEGDEDTLSVTPPIAPLGFLFAGAAYLVFSLIYLIRKLRQKRAELRIAYLLPAVALAASLIVYLADMAATRIEGRSTRTTLTIHHLPDRAITFDVLHVIGRSTQVISIAGPPFDILRSPYDRGAPATPKYQWISAPEGDRIEGFKVAKLSDRRLRLMRMESKPAPIRAMISGGRIVIESGIARERNIPAEIWDTQRGLKLDLPVQLTQARVEVILETDDDKWTDIDEPLPFAVDLLSDMSRYAIVLAADPDAGILRVTGVDGNVRHRAFTAVPVVMR